MKWFDVDGARSYLAQGDSKKPSRKTVYNMVAAGMKVARLGDTGRRVRFAEEWIDDFLKQSADTRTPELARRRA